MCIYAYLNIKLAALRLVVTAFKQSILGWANTGSHIE